jgi:hypothetical protein
MNSSFSNKVGVAVRLSLSKPCRSLVEALSKPFQRITLRHAQGDGAFKPRCTIPFNVEG